MVLGFRCRISAIFQTQASKTTAFVPREVGTRLVVPRAVGMSLVVPGSPRVVSVASPVLLVVVVP